MKRAISLLTVLCGVLLLANGWLFYHLLQAPTPTQAAPQTQSRTIPAPELAAYMGTMQRYHHKLLLSVQARNRPAADFYLHELIAQSRTIRQKVPSYEGMRIGALVNVILTPELDSLRQALDAGSWATITAQANTMTQACNDCHRSTGVDFIQIEPIRVSNPFNQRFDSPAP